MSLPYEPGEYLPSPDDNGDYYGEPEPCWACHGEGYFHDCGEDTCCCLRPEIDDCYPCHECNGKGFIYEPD